MKALVYTGPQRLALADVPAPTAANDLALVDVAAVGICGSDVHAYLGHDERRPPPLVLGHEAAGIARTGAFAGRRVTVNPLVTCERCAECRSGRHNLCPDRQILSMPPRPGAFAETLAVPDRNLVPVPDAVPLAKAALAEPLACGWHAVRRAERALERPLAAATCVVLGGGAIGLGAALVLRAWGAPSLTIVETHPGRRARLTAMGACAVVPPGDASPAAGTADLVIDAHGGARSREAASALVRAGGVIVHIGLAEAAGGLDVRRFTLQDVSFLGSYTYTPQDFVETVDALGSGRLGALDWFDERPLEAGAAAFADLVAGTVDAPKILLRPRA